MGSETEGDILDKMPADEFSNLNRREQDPLSQANGWHKALVLLTEVWHEIGSFQALFFFEN